MSICFFETSDSDRAYLESRLPNEMLHFHRGPLTSAEQAAELCRGSDIVSVFVHSIVDKDVMAAMPELMFIATRSTGYDHIDAVSAAHHGIGVSNVPTYGENTVAEHAFALLLAVSRNSCKAHVRASSGDFSLDGLTGFDLKGRTIGIIGVGHIGSHMVRIARGFGMNVLACDPMQDPTLADVLGFTYTDLIDLLNRSDIVSLNAPLTPATNHLIGWHNIHEFKRGAVLINTARGALIDTGALLHALDSGVLSAAGMDVLEGEENLSEESHLLGASVTQEGLRTALQNLALLRRHDLVITPHICFDSVEACERILAMTVENIRAFRRGVPKNLVNAVAKGSNA